MSQDMDKPVPDDLDPDTPLPFVMPPPGPVVQWSVLLVDWIYWEWADSELTWIPKPDLGEWNTHAFLLGGLLKGCIGNSQHLVRELLDAIANVRAGRLESWVENYMGDTTVAVRPDAVWLHYGYAYADEDLRAFPLDGMEAMLRRWSEAIRNYDGEE